MSKIKLLHIAVHLGGGAGKAIAGMMISAGKVAESDIVLLENPLNQTYVNQLRKQHSKVMVERDADTIGRLIPGYDVVVINWWGHPLMIRLLLEMEGVQGRFIIWSHINGCSYPYLQGAFLDRFDKVLFTTGYSLDNAAWGIKERQRIMEKSAVVYGMGDFHPEQVSPKTTCFEHSGLTIGYVGTLNYAKLHPRFLEYYKEAAKKYPGVRFVMLGEPSKEVRLAIRNSGLEEAFELPGYVDCVWAYYQRMDVFAYLLNERTYATTENALVEAMAAGLPVIVLNNPVERHIIQHGVNGLLVNNPAEFVDCIEWLSMNQNGRELGRRGRNFCISRYSASANLDVFYSACKDAMACRERTYLFREALGRSPFEAFCIQAGPEGQLFQRICDGGMEEAAEELRRLPIYLEEDKASVFQFARYFPESEELQTIARFIKQYEN